MSEDDLLIDRIAGELRVLPHVDGEAKARLLVAVAAERERDRASHERGWRRFSRPIGVAGGLAAAAILAVYLRAASPGSSSVTRAPAADIPRTSATVAAYDASAADMAPRPIQLVFRAPAASQVRVVGDFNGWDKDQAPMARDSASGLWSATLMLRPGRHVYAFVVDDTLWMRDPRAERAKDADFGRPGSVLLVGKP